MNVGNQTVLCPIDLYFLPVYGMLFIKISSFVLQRRKALHIGLE